jgi:thymidylate kinase
MATRVRKRCTKIILDKSTSPETKKKVKPIYQRLSKQSPSILRTIEDDLEVESSQEAVSQLTELFGDD